MRRPVLLLAALVALAGCGRSEPTIEEQGAELRAALRGTEQHFLALGRTQTPATLTVFAAPTDYRLLTWALEELPALARGPVRDGELAVALRPLPRGGGGSDEDAANAARSAIAAATQDHLWDFVGVLATSYVGAFDEPSTASELAATPGLDERRALQDRASERTSAAVARALERARPFGRRPPFAVLEVDGRADRLFASLDAAARAAR